MDGESDYREKAVQLAQRARAEKNPETKAELHALAASYLRLADQAASNALSYTVQEPRRKISQRRRSSPN